MKFIVYYEYYYEDFRAHGGACDAKIKFHREPTKTEAMDVFGI